MAPHLTLSKKILSILLSILLVVAFVPAVAFAGNDANDEVLAFDESVADRPVYDADDSFGGVDDSDFGGVDSSGNTEGSGGGTEITTWPDPSESENGTTENNQGNQEGKELKENSWRYTNGELTVSDESEDAGIEAYSTRSNSNKRPVAHGIDVSEHNGTINWDAVKNSGQVDFAILRVGYGDDYSYQDDKQWARNVSECERLGIPYGVYIYSYATSWNQLNSEVSHVKRLLRGHNPSYPVYIDMEDDSTIGLGRNTLTQFAKSFCDQINSAGYTAGVYANLNWWNNYLYASQLDNYERWVAQYNSSCWYEGDYGLWQYSSSGSVPGISGNVDMNYEYGASRVPRWQYVDGKWYCYIAGELQKDKWISGLYWVGSDGAMATNSWVDDNRYYVGDNGVYKMGWLLLDGKWYYLSSSKATDWRFIGDSWYYFNNDGVMQTGKVNVSGAVYKFNSSGAMVSGWDFENGKWYYYAVSGGLQKDKWISGLYWVGSDGAMATNSWVDDNRYYVGDNGAWVH